MRFRPPPTEAPFAREAGHIPTQPIVPGLTLIVAPFAAQIGRRCRRTDGGKPAREGDLGDDADPCCERTDGGKPRARWAWGTTTPPGPLPTRGSAPPISVRMISRGPPGEGRHPRSLRALIGAIAAMPSRRDPRAGGSSASGCLAWHEPRTMRDPSGLKAAVFTTRKWPCRTAISLAVALRVHPSAPDRAVRRPRHN